MVRACLAFVAGAAVVGASSSWATAPAYMVVPLNVGPGSAAYSINNNGVVVGSASTVLVGSPAQPTSGSAFYYNGTTLILPSTNVSCLYGVNDNGVAVGYQGTSVPEPVSYSSGTVTGFPTIPSTFGQGGRAYAINNNGTITLGMDVYFTQTFYTNPSYTYSNGTWVFAGYLNNSDLSILQGINSSGVAVGFSGFQAVSWNGSFHTLGSLGGAGGAAQAINNNNQIVGWSNNSQNVQHAFLYDTSMHDLNTLGGAKSDALGINLSGEVVGWSNLASGSTNHAFLYDGATMFDLNNLIAPGSGWTITSAAAINNSGQIAATGFNPSVDGGAPEALLLTPTPEPASLGLLAIGAGCLMLRKRR